jgi:hypothetical protein
MFNIFYIVNKRSVFNTLFQAGINYIDFKHLPSERIQKKMDEGYAYAKELISNIPDQLVQRLNQKLRVLFITHIRCKDSANALPVIAGLVEKLDNWKMSIIQRDDFDNEVETYYLTAGRKKVPVVILADEEGEEIIRWIERPLLSYEAMADLQVQRLSKEEYIHRYKSTPAFKPPVVTKNILDEILDTAIRATTLLQLLPKKKVIAPMQST